MTTLTTNPETKTKRIFSAEQKTRAVLEVWTESRKPAQVARELEITATLLDLWQKKAMKAILTAMEPRKSDPTKQPLPPRLENILTRQVQRAPLTRLAKRLEEVQATSRNPEPIQKKKVTKKKPANPKPKA
jgi:transposase-like protein